MIRAFRWAMVTGFVSLMAMGAGCGSDSSSSSTSGGSDAGANDAGVGDGGFTTPVDPGPGGFVLTVSGEDLVATGYDFASGALASGDPPAFVDGWSVKFDHWLVTVGNIKVNADPDKDEGNPANVGSLVAEEKGSFAVDLVKGGPITGKSGSPDERTVAIASFANTNSRFDPKVRYAFGYDLVTADANAKRVNLDAAAAGLYDEALQKGYSMMVAGTATYSGPAPQAGSVFAKLPKTVKFRLGLKNPSSYVNCRNTDLAQVGDEYPRGIQAKTSEATIVQMTVHTDHLFWSALNVEGSNLHFDPIAAQASTYGTPDSEGIVTIDDLANIDITGFRTRAGEVLPARSLVSDYESNGEPLRFDANGTSFENVNSFASFLSYSAAAGGHMNASGECEVKNRFKP